MANDKTRQIHLRISDDMLDACDHWAAKTERSRTEFIDDAIEFYIAFLNHDYRVPDILVERMNQLDEHIVSLDSSVRNEQRMIASGFKSLLGLTRGDNYLLEQDDSGELG